MSASAASFYYPDETPSYDDTEYEPPANLAWMDRHFDELAQARCKQFPIRLLPPLKLPIIETQLEETIQLHSIFEIEYSAEQEEEAEVLDLLLRLKYICKMIRAEWPDGKIAAYRAQINEAIRHLRQLLKKDVRKREFNAVQHSLFDE